MEVKQTDEATLHLEPATDDESALVGMLFEKITTLYPDWKMGDRSDLAMAAFAVVKQWAHNLELTSQSHVTVSLPVDESINGVASGDLFPLPAHVADTEV